MELEDIILSDIKQAQKTNTNDIIHERNLKQVHLIELESRMVVTGG
jgi:hypothetical protein